MASNMQVSSQSPARTNRGTKSPKKRPPKKAAAEGKSSPHRKKPSAKVKDRKLPEKAKEVDWKHSREFTQGKVKPDEHKPTPAVSPLEWRVVQERKEPASVHRKSLAGASTTVRTFATSGKSTEQKAGATSSVAGTDVKAFMKELAERHPDKYEEDRRALSAPRSVAPPSQDSFEKLLERPIIQESRPAERETVTMTTHGDRKPLFKHVLVHRRLLAAVCVTLVALVLASALCLLLISAQDKPVVSRPEPLLAQVVPACRTKECRSAMRILNLSMDTSADPCQDAYALACGRWHFTDEVGRPLTYIDMLHDRYVRQAHMNLAAKGANRLDHPVNLDVPSRIYRSCIRFFVDDRARLVDVWQAAGMDLKTWLAVRHFSELFSLVVRTFVENGLETVFVVGRAYHFPHVLTGRSMKTGDVYTFNVVTELFREANRILERYRRHIDFDIDAVKRLDDAIEKVTSAFNKNNPYHEVDPELLDNGALGVHWTPVLQNTIVRRYLFIYLFVCTKYT
ncbi:membrane metallo-endopeptidase-like 1 [Amblyomma americanum]